MRWIMVAAVCGAFIAAGTGAQAQDVQETLGRLLQGFQGQGQDVRQEPRDERATPERREGERRYTSSDRSEPEERLRTLAEADRRLDAQQRQLDEDRRRIEAERRRLRR
jgi:hypothetical protein